MNIPHPTLADASLADQMWSAEIAKVVAEGRTHSERDRISAAANQAPGGPRLQLQAAKEEADRQRRDRELAR
jgi:hypothetical protein